jgi:hypothetical protein
MRLAGAGLAAGLLAAALLAQASGQQIHRNQFETRDTSWLKGNADAPFTELVHEISDATAHTGQSSEHLQINCQQGSHVYYVYPTSPAPISDELNISLWLKGNRPGMQVLARLVLPKEPNPTNLQEPLTTLLHGDLYQESSRWHRLELRRPAKLARQQQQVLRAQMKRDVDLTDAYIDQLILNVYSGPGLADIWIDDLEIGPVLENNPFRTTSRSAGPVKLLGPSGPYPVGRSAAIELNRGQLLVNGKPFFFRGIRHSDTPLKVLREAGFNTIWFDHSTSSALMEEAVNRGFWLVPALPALDNDVRLAAAESLKQEIARFLERDAVLFWDVGGGLTEEQGPQVSQIVQLVHGADAQHPVGADVWDGFRPYCHDLDLLGVHRWPLMTGLELTQFRRWLNQRRLLTRANTFMWTWVQTHLPDWYTTLVYDRPGAAGFDEPVGPQPEQIRLLTYLAISAGYRGLGFWSDRFLADSHQGRDRLLAMALLNLELRLLEPLLMTADEPGSDETSWLKTSSPDVRAAVLRSDRGMVVLPMWTGNYAQFVPGQAALANMTITVPQVPDGTMAWEVSPAGVRCLRQERVVGGTRITLPEFGLTAMIVFTGDSGPNGVVVRFQELTRQSAKIAAQWAHDLAEEEIRKVTRIEEQLERLGHIQPDSRKLLEDAHRRLDRCTDQWNKGDYREAFAEGERALRPLRILMRAQWEAAVKDLTAPVASPYAVSFYTLPRHWAFIERIHRARAAANVLPNGDFEANPAQAADSWQPQETSLDEVTMTARRVTSEPKEGKQCLMLSIEPRLAQGRPPDALERTFLAFNSPSVHLQPGTLVRISGWVRVPKPITASADGALFYDSAGGEPLAIRLLEPTVWKQFTLYRQVPSSGSIYVTLALTGLGTVYFDDIRIEPLMGDTTASISR